MSVNWLLCIIVFCALEKDMLSRQQWLGTGDEGKKRGLLRLLWEEDASTSSLRAFVAVLIRARTSVLAEEPVIN